MKADDQPPPNDLPRAKTKKQKWSISFIWIVPIVAALLAGYLVYQRVREYGATITIQFRDVAGVKPGQTLILHRGADIGVVTAVGLSKDQKFATAKVKLRRYASSVAREGSQFWIVRPRLGIGNFTGLGTIVTGPYIAVQPGDGERKTEFTGLDSSPVTMGSSGLSIVLLSAHGRSLRAGIPIYYRGMEVGVVRDARLSTNATTVEIHCIIQRRYAPLVCEESKFWDVTGMDMRFGLFKGAEVNVESLKSLFVGGIAFATPDEPKLTPAKNGTVFRLYEQPDKKWAEWTPRIPIESAPPGEAVESDVEGNIVEQ